ncbi:amino acid permease [Paramyrothecium foliicola]|nr:amino acid permease [Paramyrothecium foliicola]
MDETSNEKVSGHSNQPMDVEEGQRLIQADRLRRSLSARQVQMIAIASMLICYAIVGGIVFVTMLCLGEMAAFIPVAGSFCTFAGRFVDDAFGFALTWNYWFNDAVSTASDLVALQLILQYWTDNFPGWALSLIFWFVLILANIITVRAYGELEYWLSLLKVITIVVFIIMGIVVNVGGNTSGHYIGGENWHIPGAPFVGGIDGGTESIAITAGETKNPTRNMPKVVKNVFWRILLFYILSILLIGLNVPYTYPNLNSKETRTSPFTIVFEMTGAHVAGSVINAVILTSVLSAGNHALFAGTRLLYTLAVERHAPSVFGRLNKHGVPWVAVLGTSLIAGLCFGASFIGAGQLWTWLQNIVGVSNQLSWISIGIASIRFRSGLARQGKTHLLPFKNWTYPVGPWVAVILNSFLVLVQGWSCFSPRFNAVDFVSYYIELPVMLLIILQAFGGGAADTVAPAVVGDLFFVHERGRAMGLYTVFLCVGPFFGGLVGGYIGYEHGWTTIFWISAALSVLVLSCVVIFVPETMFSRNDHWNTQAVQLEPAQSAHSSNKAHTMSIVEPESGTAEKLSFGQAMGMRMPRGNLWKQYPRIFRTMAFPGTWVVTLHYAGLIGGIVTVSLVGPMYVSRPPYLWGANAGLINVGGIIGAALGFLYNHITSDRRLKKQAKRLRNGMAESEDRLPTLFFSLALATGGLLVFGLSAQYPGPSRWVGLEIGFAMLSFGLMQVPATGFSYLIDSYHSLAADCFTVITILRSVIAFAWTFCVAEWSENSGPAQPFGIFAMLLGLFSLLTVPLWIWGCVSATVVTAQSNNYLDWRNFKAYGVNVGGWLHQEQVIDPRWWNSNANGTTDEWDFCEALGNRCGAVLEQRYASYITTADIDILANAGVNVLRIPTGYNAWVSVPGSKLYTGNQVRFLKIIGEYAITRYNMHIILDIHSLPGGVNGMGLGGKEGGFAWFGNQTALQYSYGAVDAVIAFIQASSRPSGWTLQPLNEPVDNRDPSTFGTPAALSDVGAAWVLSYFEGVVSRVQVKNPKIPVMIQGSFRPVDFWSSHWAASTNIVFDVHNYYFAGRPTTSANLPTWICQDAKAGKGNGNKSIQKPQFWASDLGKVLFW